MAAHWEADSKAPQIVLAADAGQYQVRSLEVSADGHRAVLFNKPTFGAVPDVSPDGKWIAFSSIANGVMEILISAFEGGSRRAVTRLEGSVVTDADWSPDGRHIAIHARRQGVNEGRAQIYVIDVDPAAELARAESAPPLAVTRQLTNTPDASIAGPRWTPDAKYLYGTKLPNEVVRIDARSGEVERLFEGDSPQPQGSKLFYGKDGQFGLYARSLTGDVRSNPEERILPDFVPPRGFDVTGRGVFYLGRDASRRPAAARFFDFGLRKSFDLGEPPSGVLPRVAASQDGRRVVFDSILDGSGGLTWMQLREVRR